MAHVFHRTLVLPGPIHSQLDGPGGIGSVPQHEKARVSLVFDFAALSAWVPVISMQQYLNTK